MGYKDYRLCDSRGILPLWRIEYPAHNAEAEVAAAKVAPEPVTNSTKADAANVTAVCKRLHKAEVRVAATGDPEYWVGQKVQAYVQQTWIGLEQKEWVDAE